MEHKPPLREDLRRLLPLTPAMFFVMFSLADGEKHGYAIMKEATLLSEGKVRMGPGTLYTTLQRLLDLQLIEEVHTAASSAERGRRYYRLNADGQLLLDAELARMDSILRLAKSKNKRKRLVPKTAD